MNSLTAVGAAEEPGWGFPRWSGEPRPAASEAGWCLARGSADLGGLTGASTETCTPRFDKTSTCDDNTLLIQC